MLYKNLFQLYPDNFQNNYFLLSDKLEDIRYLFIEGALCLFVLFPGILGLCFVLVHQGSQVSPRGLTLNLQLTYLQGNFDK